MEEDYIMYTCSNTQNEILVLCAGFDFASSDDRRQLHWEQEGPWFSAPLYGYPLRFGEFQIFRNPLVVRCIHIHQGIRGITVRPAPPPPFLKRLRTEIAEGYVSLLFYDLAIKVTGRLGQGEGGSKTCASSYRPFFSISWGFSEIFPTNTYA